MANVTVSQLPIDVLLRWRAGDPVNLSVTVLGYNWAGTHTATVNGVTMGVTATLVGADTVFVFTLAQAASVTLGAGKFAFQCRNAAGLTRFVGMAEVAS